MSNVFLLRVGGGLVLKQSNKSDWKWFFSSIDQMNKTTFFLPK